MLPDAVTSKTFPLASDTAPDQPKDNSVVGPVTELKDNTVNTPLPAAISAFVNEKPTTVPLAADTV